MTVPRDGRRILTNTGYTGKPYFSYFLARGSGNIAIAKLAWPSDGHGGSTHYPVADLAIVI